MIIKPCKNNVKLLGRAYEVEDVLVLSFSGSGMAFNAKKGQLSITFIGDSTSKEDGSKNDRTRIGIFQGEKRIMDFMLDEPEKTVSFGINEDSEISVIKLSECAMSTCAVKSIEVAEAVTPAENKSFLVEFIGDSITCGFGIDDEDPFHEFKTETEDTSEAYAFRTARKLGCDIRPVSISGYGIISGYSDDGETRHADQLIPSFYEKCGYSYSNFELGQPQDRAWDFALERPAKIVVINLGTNDDSYCTEHLDRQQWFEKDYIEFLKTVRRYNPDSMIVCTLGIMGTRLCPFVESAVKAYREGGDQKVVFMPFENQLESDGYVSCYHPTKITHEKASQKLFEELKKYI